MVEYATVKVLGMLFRVYLVYIILINVCFRDTMIYAASLDTRGLDPVIHLLSDVILRPKFTADEVNFAVNKYA